ncbi:MAG: EAL domain-containing protein [Gammaproteobacteria bacterium]|nr:EAL domain-containing protein [Gammaproteobacteria bacterium]MDH5309219.1 EAL domain-containing protein [Gammaproteobacteria bacterium]
MKIRSPRTVAARDAGVCTRRAAAADGEGSTNSAWDPERAASRASEPAASPNIVFTAGADGEIRALVDMPAAPDNPLPDMAQGRRLDEIFTPAVARTLQDNVRRVLRSRQISSAKLRLDGPQKEYEFIFIAQGRDSVIIVARDVTVTEGRISELEKLAYYDAVTGLPNREWLLAQLRESIERLALSGGRAAIICLDIGQLDVVENASSRACRDGVLRELAERLQSGLRGANQVGEHDDERFSAVARTDFRVFTVLLPSIETGEDAAGVSARLVESLERPIENDGRASTVTVSAGIALYPQDGGSGEELFTSAVTAMHDAKSSITQQQKFHSGTVRMRALERQDLELELRAALENGEFTLTYMPIVASDNRKIFAAEALLRWPKPLFHARPIDEIVAVAEYTGLILPIGEWVFDRVCAQLDEWCRLGRAPSKIAVNVSAQEFARANLVERTRSILGRLSIDPARIIIEITEKILFRDSMDDFAVCRRLRELGVSVSVDDFGTGVCSFDHLSRSPVDSVKIHPSIVARSSDSGPGRAACAAITAMAHTLGMSVIAERVESEDQVQVLAEIGCDYLQGFALAQPMDPSELARLIESGSES